MSKCARETCWPILLLLLFSSTAYPKVIAQARVSYYGTSPFESSVSFFAFKELPFPTDKTNTDTSSIYAVIWFSEMERFIIRTQVSAPMDTLTEAVMYFFMKGIGADKLEGEQVNEPHFQSWVIDSIKFVVK